MIANQDKPKIIILGGGFGGAYCARQLEQQLDDDEAEITLINRTNYFVFTPLLVEAGTGALEPRHTVIPLRRFLKRTRLITGEVRDINLTDSEVVAESFFIRRHVEKYDHLVISLGSVTRLPDVPGLNEHGFGMKSLGDAIAIRDRAIGLLEIANETEDSKERRKLLTFVVVGANYTGVEVAGEYQEFLTEATSIYPNIEPEEIRVILIEMESRILPTLDKELAQYASDRLTSRGVKLQLNQTLSRIEPDYAELESGEIIDSSTVVWVAGVTQNPILKEIDLAQNKLGYLECEPDLRVSGTETIWGIGDSAANPDPNGKPYPPTAQHAIREGRAAADNLVSVLRDKTTKPFEYRSQGMMAPLGRHKAVARILGWKLSGFPAWFLWRTFYLFKMPGWGRSLRVMLDWTLDLIFRRDYVPLGIHEKQLPLAGEESCIQSRPDTATEGQADKAS